MRLAALKREEDGLQREKERLEAEKERHFRYAPCQQYDAPTTESNSLKKFLLSKLAAKKQDTQLWDRCSKNILQRSAHL